MNIKIFLQALSDSEVEELKQYFLNKEKDRIYLLVRIEDFVRENHMSTRLKNALLSKKYEHGVGYTDLPLFRFINDITLGDLFLIRNFGKKSARELRDILKRYNISI